MLMERLQIKAEVGGTSTVIGKQMLGHSPPGRCNVGRVKIRWSDPRGNCCWSGQEFTNSEECLLLHIFLDRKLVKPEFWFDSSDFKTLMCYQDLAMKECGSDSDEPGDTFLKRVFHKCSMKT